MTVTKRNSRVIVALDGLSFPQAVDLAADLADVGVAGFKANDLLYGSVSVNTIIETLRQYGEVFVDVKVHDTPQTVANTVAKIARMGASIITVHASGGPEMLKRAVEAFEENRQRGARGIFPVTILTSHTEESCQRIYGASVMQKVREFAVDAANAGATGVICSPSDLAQLRYQLSNLRSKEFEKGFQYITPGIRPTGAEVRGQARPDTPTTAIKGGSTLLVVGSPIYAAADPTEALHLINEEVAAAL